MEFRRFDHGISRLRDWQPAPLLGCMERFATPAKPTSDVFMNRPFQDKGQKKMSFRGLTGDKKMSFQGITSPHNDQLTLLSQAWPQDLARRGGRGGEGDKGG